MRCCVISRFYDLFECRGAEWKIVFLQPIYESDGLNPVQPGTASAIQAELLASFPKDYRYLGYLQPKLGMTVKRDMPGVVGPEVDALYERDEAWLASAN